MDIDPTSSSFQEEFEDFFEHSLCGFITCDNEGRILRCNTRMLEWTGASEDEIKRKRFSDLLSIGGKIYYETHLWPLLSMQGFFDEVALELTGRDNERLPVLVNALQRQDKNSRPSFIRFTIFRASDRRKYEQNLQAAKKNAETNLDNEREVAALREQFIAVLGHDLRNPLGAITAAAELLSNSRLDGNEGKLVDLIRRSGSRIGELIENLMDFARTRMGEGIILNRKETSIEPILYHVVDELRAIYPDRVIETEFNNPAPINCDPDRIAQVLSNLLANALTHGSGGTPVKVRAIQTIGNFELSVSNEGAPIPATILEKIFEPFTRETARPSQHGLGLGLYIASEITRAHQGELSCTSTNEETRFLFRMSIK